MVATTRLRDRDLAASELHKTRGKPLDPAARDSASRLRRRKLADLAAIKLG